jgi:hypothetical protein
MKNNCHRSKQTRHSILFWARLIQNLFLSCLTLMLFVRFVSISRVDPFNDNFESLLCIRLTEPNRC